MESVNVLVTYPPPGPQRLMGDDWERLIKGVSPTIEVSDIGALVQAEQTGDSAAGERLDSLLAGAEVIYGFPPPENLMRRAPNLKWIQTPLTGVDMFLIPDIIESPVILTNSSGIHGTQASELVLELMLMLARQARLYFQLQQEKRWVSFVPTLLHSKTVGVLGFGAIGREVARLTKAFGMKVAVMEARQVEKPEYVDVIMPPEQLPEILAESDYVVVALPLTPETDKLIGETEFKTMKPTAYFVNIARGGIVDEDALYRALNEEWIAGAGLDVFATEPLPADSKLWELPNVIITPHSAGQRPDYGVLATGLFCENLKRYISGQELLNVVDKRKGF